MRNSLVGTEGLIGRTYRLAASHTGSARSLRAQPVSECGSTDSINSIFVDEGISEGAARVLVLDAFR